MNDRDADAPHLPAVDEGPCSIDRVDDKNRFPVKSRFVVVGFFRQPAVIRPGLQQPVLQDIVGGEIGGADRRTAFVLPPDLRILAEELERALASSRRRGRDEVQIGAPGRGQRA